MKCRQSPTSLSGPIGHARSFRLRAAAIAVMGVLAHHSAHAIVIYDTTAMTDNQTYGTQAGTLSFIGGAANHAGQFFEQQVTEDFVLSEPHRITRLTADFLTRAATPPIVPSDGMLIEVFHDIDGRPANFTEMDPVIQFVASSSLLTSSTFPNQVQLSSFNTTGIRLSVDLSLQDFELPAGRWWVAMQPMDLTPAGLDYLHLGNPVKSVLHSSPHSRRSSVAHATGYGGTGGPTDGTWVTTVPALVRDLSLKIEGEVVQASEPGDVTGNGVVNVDDLLAVISAWGPCPPKGSCAADIAPVVGNGVVNVDDLLMVISNWG